MTLSSLVAGRFAVGCVAFAAWLACAHGASVAQVAGTHAGVLAGMFNTTPGTNSMLRLDAQNTPTTIVTSIGGAWPYWGVPFGMPVDTDNHHVVIPGLVDLGGSIGVLARWDPVAGAVTGTLWSGTLGPATVRNWSNWTINADGNPVTIDNGSSPQALVEFDRLANAWNRVPLPASVPAFAGVGGLDWDPIAGGYTHAAWGVGTSGSALYRTTPTGFITTALALTTVRIAGFGGTLLQDGSWLSGDAAPRDYRVVARGSATWTVGSATPAGALSDVTRERFAAPGRGFFAAQAGGTRGLVYVDAVAATTVALHVGTAATMPATVAEITPLFTRDLTTVRTGKATWDLRVRPAGGQFAGKSFRAVVSAAWPRPPVLLPDGRELFVGIDLLSVISARGPIPPFFSGNGGMLDATGSARARLDFSSIGEALDGVVLHFAAVVIDPVAPSGIGWVCEPWAFAVDVRP